MAVDGARRRDGVRRVECPPAAECDLPHSLPERAVVERLAAGAERVVAQPSLPEVAHLADRRHARDVTQQEVEHRAATTAEAAHEEDADAHRAGAIMRPGGVAGAGRSGGAAAGTASCSSSDCRQSSAHAIITRYIATGRKS